MDAEHTTDNAIYPPNVEIFDWVQIQCLSNELVG